MLFGESSDRMASQALHRTPESLENVERLLLLGSLTFLACCLSVSRMQGDDVGLELRKRAAQAAQTWAMNLPLRPAMLLLLLATTAQGAASGKAAASAVCLALMNMTSKCYFCQVIRQAMVCEICPTAARHSVASRQHARNLTAEETAA